MMERNAYLHILKANPRNIQNWRFYRHGLEDVGLWSLMILLVQLAPLYVSYPLNSMLLVVFTFRAFGIMHDCVHDAALRSREANNWIGWIWGVFCVLPYGPWKRLHLDHHRWTGNVEKDPSMRLLIEFRDHGFSRRPWLPIFWNKWVPTLALEQHFVFWRATIGKKESWFVVAGASYLSAAGYLLGPVTVVTGILAYLVAVEVINFPHHLDFAQAGGEAQFKTSDQIPFCRSCDYPRWFARFALCNFNLHIEHHLFPAHPWYQLDKISEDLKESGVAMTRTRGNQWIRKNRKAQLGEVLSRTFTREEIKESNEREVRVA